MKPYPKYKDSGLVWLGKIPEHWSTSKFRYVGRFAGGGTPSKDNLTFWNGSIPWVSPKDMKSDIISDSIDKITPEAVSSSATKIIPKNCVLMVVRSGILQHTIPVGINSIPVSLNQDMKAIIPKEEILPKYIFYFIKGANTELLDLWSKQGATVESLEHEYITKTEITLPPLPEQRAIAAYLDRETAKIDTLVGKQEQLIALLEEKRQALISHAVTKGLDPNVKMKASGVEWLGEVPEHWVAWRLKHLVRKGFMYGANEAALSDNPDDPRFIRITDIENDNTLSADTFKSLPMNLARPYLLADGDMLLARSGATVGKSFLYSAKWGPACFAGYLIKVSLQKTVLAPEYLNFCLQSKYYWEFIRGSQIQSTIQNVSAEKYAQFPVAVPLSNEQAAIISYLNSESLKFARLTANAQRAIDLLREKRSALISAAVTGKIDVTHVGDRKAVATALDAGMRDPSTPSTGSGDEGGPADALASPVPEPVEGPVK